MKAIIFCIPFVLLGLLQACTEQVQHTETAELKGDLEGLYLPDELQASVWAESPHFYNPTNIDVDIKGRVWITEAVNYRNFNNDTTSHLHHRKGDRVIILEDSDGDGKCDTSKVFVQDQDLIAPLGIAVIGNKVIVSCSPSIIIYTDEDNDDVADKKEIFLTGFGGRDHDHGLHALLAGPDGKWYLNAGNAGPHYVKDKAGWILRSGSLYNGGTPYGEPNSPGLKSDDGKVWAGGIALRVNPDGTGLEVMGHNFRNAYELTVDSYGHMWQNDNDDEIQSCRTSWIMEKGNAGYASADGFRTWQADRRPGQTIQTAHWHQEDPGVMPVGDMTGAGSPTGVTVYEGDELGESYRGMLLSADAGRNVIFGYKPEAKGAGYKLNRFNFITSVKESTEQYVWNEKVTDHRKWFRPSDIATGTDGALYIADWYDPIVGGHAMDDSVGFGRIYRITPRSRKLKSPEIDLSSIEGQIKALLSPAVNVRFAGYEKLKAAGTPALPQLKKVLNSNNPYHTARVLWLLAEIPEGVSEVEKALNHSNSEIRVTALRALRNAGKLDDTKIRELSSHPDAAVRREIAFSLHNKPYKGVYKDALIKLAQLATSNDRTYLEAIGTAAEGKEEELYKDLLALNEQDPLAWDKSFATVTWRLHPVSSIPALKARAKASILSPEERKQAMNALGFIKHPKAANAMLELTHHTLEDVSQQAEWWLLFRKTNDWYTYELKGWKIPEGNLVRNPEALSLKNKVQDASLPTEEKIKAAKAMSEDPTGTLMLIGLAASGQLQDEIKEAIKPLVIKNADRTLNALARNYFGYIAEDAVNPSRILELKGDAIKGKTLFMGNCGYCHMVNKMGAETGPNLTTVKSKFDKRGLLEAIIYPNKGVEFGYSPVIITTKDGAAVLGFIYTDGKIIVIKSQYGQMHTIERDKVDMKVQLYSSIMPDPAIMELQEESLAHIVSYLMSM